MDKITTTPLSGTRDFLPRAKAYRDRKLKIAIEVVERYGFLPIETPAMERVETLLGKYGEDEKLIFKILPRGEKEASGEADSALRYDFTVPLARVYAQYRNELPKIFKRYQYGPVWRADRPGKGRFREFYQFDLDIIGTSDLSADAEIIVALCNILSVLGLEDITVNLNSRKVLQGLLEQYGIDDTQRKSTLIALDKIGKIGIQGVKEELLKKGVKQEIVEEISNDMGNASPLSATTKRLHTSETGQAGLDEIGTVTRYIKAMNTKAKVVFAPFLARGLDYYTGPIFEITVPGSNNSIAAGGRYDDLIGTLSGGQAVPACGGSLGIERILMLLTDTQEEYAPIKVFFCVLDENLRIEVMTLASELRSGGVSTEVFLRQASLSDQLRYASQRNIPLSLIYGQEEKDQRHVQIKYMKSGKKRVVSMDALLEVVNEYKKEDQQWEPV